MLRPVLPVFQYIINQDYIAEYLCINKDKPMLNCIGKCFLAKQLAAQNEEKKQNIPAINLQDYPIGFVELLQISFPKSFSTEKKELFFYPFLFDNLFRKNIFHPPILK